MKHEQKYKETVENLEEWKKNNQIFALEILRTF